jgi:exopolysaccharide biosynthesis polyprenyl glycosylphosphotransferase
MRFRTVMLDQRRPEPVGVELADPLSVNGGRRMATTDNVRAEPNERSAWSAPTNSVLSLHISERKLLLGLMDLLIVNLSLFITLAMRMNFNLTWQSFTDRISWFLILSAVWLVCGFMLECYNLTRAADALSSTTRAAAAVAVTWLIYLLIPYVTPALPTSRLDVVAFPVLALAGVASWRTAYARVLVQPGFHQRGLVIGAGWAGRTLVTTMNEINRGNGKYHQIGYQIVGFVDDDPAKQGMTLDHVPVLGTRRDLAALVERWQPNELIVAITHTETMSAELFEGILECGELGLSITTMAAFYERLTGRVPIEHAGRELHVTLPLSRSATHRFYLGVGRLVDICAGALGCVLLALLAPLVLLANRLTAPGPLFYHQERVGKGGRRIEVIKFRSMIDDAERETGAVWAVENDNRITPIGNLLRKTRLDEVPQFLNVLRGDMSLIGPRPERPQFVNQLAEQIPFYRVRHAVKPGLTGWAQVKYRYGASVEDSLVKLQYDLFYIKHQGPLLDLKIVLKTIPIVFGFKGR